MVTELVMGTYGVACFVAGIIFGLFTAALFRANK